MSESERWTAYESPLGVLTVIVAPDGALRSVSFPGREWDLDPEAECPIEGVTGQLDEYFAGERRGFDLDLDLYGEALQMEVWASLGEIPFGSTVSYGELTEKIDPAVFPAGLEPYERVRATAREIGRTPVPIVVPCHRVVGADGRLTGFGGGLERKRILLELERRVAAGLSPEPAWAQEQLAIL
ncbi:MAG TPA: methylated-DNA--[protein]-cysteine S-methyltransferase [Solirubrobacterales bacterium]|nr:methylated-DNA--[protein]-cysteine S-methyltransferase [Solirubrobacterales bacterium]